MTEETNLGLTRREALALRFYEDLRAEARRVARYFADECCAAPDWTLDDRYQLRLAYCRADDFLHAGELDDPRRPFPRDDGVSRVWLEAAGRFRCLGRVQRMDTQREMEDVPRASWLSCWRRVRPTGRMSLYAELLEEDRS